MIDTCTKLTYQGETAHVLEVGAGDGTYDYSAYLGGKARTGIGDVQCDSGLRTGLEWEEADREKEKVRERERSIGVRTSKVGTECVGTNEVRTTHLREHGVPSATSAYGIPKIILRDKKVGSGAGRGVFGFKPGEKEFLKYSFDEEKIGADVLDEEKIGADGHLKKGCTHLQERCMERDNDFGRKVKDDWELADKVCTVHTSPGTKTRSEGSLGTEENEICTGPGTKTRSRSAGSLGTEENEICTVHIILCTNRRSVLGNIHCGQFPSTDFLAKIDVQTQISMETASTKRVMWLSRLSDESCNRALKLGSREPLGTSDIARDTAPMFPVKYLVGTLRSKVR